MTTADELWVFKTCSDPEKRGWDHKVAVEDGETWNQAFSSLTGSFMKGRRNWQDDLAPGQLGLWYDTYDRDIFAVCALDGRYHEEDDGDWLGGTTAFRLFTCHVRTATQTWPDLGLPSLSIPNFNVVLLRGEEARTLLKRLPSL